MNSGMNKIYIALVTLLVFCACRNRGSDDPLEKKLTAAEAEHDLKVFTSILQDEHPAQYEYVTKEKFDELVKETEGSLKNGATLRELYNKLMNLVNELGCSHTDLDYPQHIYDTLDNRRYFFPYPVIWIDEKLLVNVSGHELDAGTEIREINGVPAKKIMQDLMFYNPVEGKHRPVQMEIAADGFAVEYFMRYGKKDKFELAVTDTSGFKFLYTAKPITFEQSRSRRYDRYYGDFTNVDYDFSIDEYRGYALLRLCTFSFSGSQKQTAFENFIKNSFELLHDKKEIRNLVIDLRENTGGTLNNVYRLFAYFARQPFKECNCAFSRINSVPYVQYLDSSSREDIPGFNNSIHSEFTDHRKKGYNYIPDSLLTTWEVEPDHFDGKVFVITDFKVNSAASYFAALVKNSGVGEVVGNNTTGGTRSSNGYGILTYALPESGIKLNVPYAHWDFTFGVYDSGMGMQPNHFVPDNLESFKGNHDRQLSYILDSLILN